MNPFLQLLLLCAATAACSMTLAKMKVAQPLHSLVERLGQVWLVDLLTCPWCLSFWFGLFWVLVTGSGGGDLVGVLFLTSATAAGSIVLGGVMLRVMFMPEREAHGLRERLRQAGEEAANQTFLRKEAEAREAAERKTLAEAREALARSGSLVEAMRGVNNNLSAEVRRLRNAMFRGDQANILGDQAPEKYNGFIPPRAMPPAPAPDRQNDPRLPGRTTTGDAP